MPIQKIARYDWVKRWHERYTLLGCSYFGYHYIKSARKGLGEGFSRALFIFNKGMVTCYRTESDTRRIGKHLAAQLVCDPSLAKEWNRTLRKKTDELKMFLSRPARDFLDWKTYCAFRILFDEYFPLYVRVYLVADYLPGEVLRKVVPPLQDARVYTEHIYHDFTDCLRRILRLLGKRTNRSPKLLQQMTLDEFHTSLKSGAAPSVRILQARANECGLYVADTKEEVLDTKNARFIEALFSRESKQEGGVIKGQPACPGIARGIVRIVHDPKKPGIFHEGDVLVTRMTNPEFLPLMKKSVAIVTDAGGMLSHAAITARELKKPCIIGTKNASSRLKNGTIVEVDANRGVVNVSS